MNILDEILLTFSSKPSLISSKKIERFIVFTVFLGLSIFYLWTHMVTISVTDFILLTGMWLGYGGYNSYLLKKGTKPDEGQNKSGES